MPDPNDIPHLRGLLEAATKETIVEFALHGPALLDEIERLRSALREISELQPRPFEGRPADWSEQIEACHECQSYRQHPIQRGICDTHRQPIWAGERHDQHEREALGPRAKLIAFQSLPHTEGGDPR